MKKFLTILSLVVLMQSNKVSAQITLEHVFPFCVNSPEDVRMQLYNIGNNQYKFIYTNYLTNQLVLLNLDYSNYATVNVPITLTSEAIYTICYVTKSLFDCDTIMFEYAIIPYDFRNNFYVYREDGTLLFQTDSVVAAYCFGCLSGSYDVRPIINTPTGAKLFLYRVDTTGLFKSTEVYSLCGTLPENVMEIGTAFATYVQEYPNPSSGTAEFKFQLPSNIENYELIIYDASGHNINTVKILGATTNYQMEENQLNSGLYFYTLNTKNKVLQTGKFIISK